MGFFSDLFKSKTAKGLKKAENLIRDIELPDLQGTLVELGRLVELGQLDPAAADAILQERTGFDDIQLDPELRQAQFTALQRFQEIASSEGLDAQAKARILEAQSVTQQQLKGDIGAIEQQARARGEVTTGLTGVNKLLAAQAAANRQATAGFSGAALAEQRALEALRTSANLAGGIEESDFQRQAKAAQAQDIINQFNVGQKSEAQRAADRAQEFNIRGETSRDIFNIQQGDEEERARAAAVQKEFENRFKQGTAQAELITRRGEAQQAQRQQNFATVGKTVKAVGSFFSDERVKENVQELDSFDVDEFLNNLTGFKFNIQGNPEDKMGVMSRDLMNSKIGRESVKSTPIGVDIVNFAETLPAMLASLAQLNSRVNRMEGR